LLSIHIPACEYTPQRRISNLVKALCWAVWSLDYDHKDNKQYIFNEMHGDHGVNCQWAFFNLCLKKIIFSLLQSHRVPEKCPDIFKRIKRSPPSCSIFARWRTTFYLFKYVGSLKSSWDEQAEDLSSNQPPEKCMIELGRYLAVWAHISDLLPNIIGHPQIR
jgi:hypothetical protein